MMGSRNRDDFFADCVEPSYNYKREREFNEEASSTSENAFQIDRQQDGTQIVIFNIPSNHTEKDVEDFLTSVVEKVDCGALWNLKVKHDKKSSSLKFAYATFNTPEVAAEVVEIINRDEFPMTGIDKTYSSTFNRLYAKVHIPKQGGFNRHSGNNRQNFFDPPNGRNNWQPQSHTQYSRSTSSGRQLNARQTEIPLIPDERGVFSAEIIPESINLPFFTVIKNGFKLEDINLEKLAPLQITSNMRNSTCIYLEESTEQKRVIPKLAVVRVPNPSMFGYSEIELIGGEIVNAFNRKLCSTPGNSEIINCELKGYASKNPELCEVLLKQYLNCRKQTYSESNCSYLCRIIPLGANDSPMKVKLYKEAEDAMIDFVNILDDLNLIDAKNPKITTYQNKTTFERQSISPLTSKFASQFKSPSRIREFVPASGTSGLLQAPTGPEFATRGVVFKPPAAANKPVILQRSSPSPHEALQALMKPSPIAQNDDVSSTQPITEKTSTADINETSSITSNDSEVGSLIFEHDETPKLLKSDLNSSCSAVIPSRKVSDSETPVLIQKKERIPSPLSDNLSLSSSSAASKLSEISLNAPEIVKESELSPKTSPSSRRSSISISSSSTNNNTVIYNLPLPRESVMTAKITYVNRPFFWAQPLDSAIEFWSLEKALLDKVDHIRPVGTVKVGSFVTAICREKVFRAVYLGDDENLHRVYLIDYGHVELVNVISLNRPKEFWSLPAQAIPFTPEVETITKENDESIQQKFDELKSLQDQILDINLADLNESVSLEMRTLALAFGDVTKTASDEYFKLIPSAFLPSLNLESSNTPSETEL